MRRRELTTARGSRTRWRIFKPICSRNFSPGAVKRISMTIRTDEELQAVAEELVVQTLHTHQVVEVVQVDIDLLMEHQQEVIVLVQRL